MTVIELHQEAFGIDPVVIGLHWDNVSEKILEAIDQGQPYDETKMLTPQELARFNAGDMIF